MQASWELVGAAVMVSLGIFNILVSQLKKVSWWGSIKASIDPVRVMLGGLLSVGLSNWLIGMTPEMMAAVTSGFAAGSWAGHKAFKKKD